MKLYFPDGSIIEKPFGSDLTGVTNKHGERPQHVTLESSEVEELIKPSAAATLKRRQNYKYIKGMITNAIQGKGNITILIC